MLICKFGAQIKLAYTALRLQRQMSHRRRHEQAESDSEQAKEVHEQVEESKEQPPISESQGEDLLQNPQDDYRQIDELDRYENEGVDNEEISHNPEDRRAAEDELMRREMDKMKIGTANDLEEYFDEELDEAVRDRQRNKRLDEMIDPEDIDENRFNNPEDVKGKLAEWIKEDSTIKYIHFKFSNFLLKWKGAELSPVYRTPFYQMCSNNMQSLRVSYNHLKEALPSIAMWVGLQPSVILPELHSCLYLLACRNYKVYGQIYKESFVRIYDLPIMDHIRDLRYLHLGKLIKIRGVITSRSEVFSQMRRAYFKCSKCGEIKGPFITHLGIKLTLGACSSCQSPGPFTISTFRTLYENYQKITLQESPSEVLPGRIPRSKQVLIYGDNINKARPGDQIEIIGVYTSRYDYYVNIKHGFPLLTTLVEVNSITVQNGERQGKFQQIDLIKFESMAKDKNIANKIYGSIAPSIYGHQFVKKSLTLAMFGGVQKTKIHRVRGDINVLLLGDPGIAKSQFLKSVQKIFPRCVYTTGKGASAVGLTASVKMDRMTGEWRLEAGALVIADKGICLIDEFDKMSEQDRTSIHEAMEQQTISVSKAGIVATLRARCSVIAAANPIKGRYDPTLSFKDNIELTDPILSRFDILNVMRDEANVQIDTHLSTFVINSHIESHPYLEKYELAVNKLQEEVDARPFIEFDLLKAYIQFAREKCKPALTSREAEMINQFYVKLREEADKKGGMNIAPRHIEAIIRMTEAHAKMHLRNQTTKEDAAVGIRTMLESFIQTQKYSTAKDIRKKFQNFIE